MLPKKMSGIILTGHGGPEKLLFSENLDVPSAKKGEVLIKVLAAGVNNTDINTRIGWYSKTNTAEDTSWAGNQIKFPLIQGIDGYGEIVAVGEGVAKNRVGQRVLVEPCITEHEGKKLHSPFFFGSEINGAFAKYTKVPSIHAYQVKDTFSSLELASFPCSYSTAENMFIRGKVNAQDKVLITGASGGVGSAAIQLAKLRKCEVFAITSKAKLQKLKEIGADHTFARDDNHLSILGKNSIDVVIDLVGGKNFKHLVEILKPKGRYLVSGAVDSPSVNLDLRTLYLNDLSFIGCTRLEKNTFQNLINYIDNKEIRPLIAKTYSLSNIRNAQEEFLKHKHVGKIVLDLEAL